jgi:putative methionine-R-sulfoxide reductase with GAF domain
MATTTKKGSKNKKAKPRRPVVNTSVAEHVQTIAELRQQLAESLQRENATASENVRLFQELSDKTTELESSNSQLREALEQQTATSEILGVIASSPTDLQPVLDVIAENAARICGADDAMIRLVQDDGLRVAAHHGSIMPHAPDITRIDRGTVHGRAVFERQTIHVHDMGVEAAKEFPQSTARLSGIRTALATPLMREGSPIGVIHIRRTEVRPFTDKWDPRLPGIKEIFQSLSVFNAPHLTARARTHEKKP